MSEQMEQVVARFKFAIFSLRKLQQSEQVAVLQQVFGKSGVDVLEVIASQPAVEVEVAGPSREWLAGWLKLIPSRHDHCLVRREWMESAFALWPQKPVEYLTVGGFASDLARELGWKVERQTEEGFILRRS